MNAKTETAANQRRDDGARLLLLVERRNRVDSLAGWVDTQDEYTALEGADQTISESSFDLCVFDRAGFQRYEQQLRELKRNGEQPQPYVLVVPERASEFPRGWDDIDSEFSGVVDDVMRRPLRDLHVRATLERNLRLRRERADHQQTSTRLARYERTVDAMAHALYVTDTDGTITFVNPAFTAITGYDREEAIGATPALLRSGYHDDEYYRQLWETISAGEVWAENVVNERKNGEQYHAEQTIVPVTGEDGTIQNYVAVQTDVTERVNKTQQLEVLDRILRHNLRNDMSVIQTRAELLTQGLTNGLVTHAETILRKSRELVETADKEREVVRLLLSGESRAEQDVTQVAHRTVTGVQKSYPDATVESEIESGVSWLASEKLDRAIEELLVNAVVHNDSDEPTVRLIVRTTDQCLEITVTDDGPGIPDTETAVLTGADSLDPLFHGSGLGLWLVYWIGRFSGGTLTFAENQPCGSVVTLRIPETEQG